MDPDEVRIAHAVEEGEAVVEQYRAGVDTVVRR
jgi:hypothetical protein